MARILFPAEDPWYDELKIISSYYETELEKIILSHVEMVFPNYVTIPFKKVLNIPRVKKGKAPDLAIISKKYDEWWIIEVETDDDDLSHVKSQVQVFANYDYNNYEVAKYIYSKDESNTLDLNLLVTMVRDIKPKVLVMVDEVSQEWRDEINTLGATICVFQVYKNKDGSHAFRINGEYPRIFLGNKSHCEFVKSPANTLQIKDAGWLEDLLKRKKVATKPNLFSKEYWREKHYLKQKGQVNASIEKMEVEIDFLGKVSKWSVILDEDKFYLKSVGYNVVPVINTYSLKADDKNRLYLKHN